MSVCRWSCEEQRDVGGDVCVCVCAGGAVKNSVMMVMCVCAGGAGAAAVQKDAAVASLGASHR